LSFASIFATVSPTFVQLTALLCGAEGKRNKVYVE